MRGAGWSPLGQSCQAGEEKQQPDTYPIEAGSYLHRSPHTLFFEHDKNFNSIYTNITHHWSYIGNISLQGNFILKENKIGCILKFINVFALVWWYHHCSYPENRALGKVFPSQ